MWYCHSTTAGLSVINVYVLMYTYASKNNFNQNTNRVKLGYYFDFTVCQQNRFIKIKPRILYRKDKHSQTLT